jgi:hypothetical protein
MWSKDLTSPLFTCRTSQRQGKFVVVHFAVSSFSVSARNTPLDPFWADLVTAPWFLGESLPAPARPTGSGFARGVFQHVKISRW